MAALAAACFVAAAALAGWLLWTIHTERRRAATRSTPPSAAPGPADARALGANRPGWLKILDAPTLIQVCNLSTVLQQIHRESKLSHAVWARDLLPAIHRYLEYVQLLPASEAHHHAHVGGLAAHTVEVVHAAIAIRNGYLLPRGGAAEAIDAQRDHWTYAVILGALLHDIGKPMTDLRVSIADRADGPARPWLPISGDMPTAGAVEYEVGFPPKAERNYGAHRRLPLVLAPRIVPATALAFVAREPLVMQHLEAAWSGDEPTNVLAEIVRQADRRSAALNLQQGPRQQFAAATAVPLVERLMEALRRLLRQGALPINRDGAAAWVGGGAIWFVAKRLADAVRDEIERSTPDDAGVPGPAKNDRLFDAWQDYGLLERNPDTGQAVWYVEIRGPGYAHEFAMLKFPLGKVFEERDAFPPDFEGDIVPRQPTAAREKGGDSEATSDAMPRPRKGGKTREETVPAPKPAHAGAKPPPGAAPTEAPAPTRRDEEAPTAAPARSNTPEPRIANGEADFLADDDSAAAGARRPPPRLGRPVTPFAPPPAEPVTGAGANGDEPSEPATRFMTWLQHGLADGSIAYNTAGAPVHFVPDGMALVSPRTFREFATLYGEDGAGTNAEPAASDKLGTGIQRHVIKARWHLVGSGNANVHRFSVLGRGGKRVGKLSAVVIQHPERWLNPVPPVNPNIVPYSDATEDLPEGPGKQP